MIFYFSGTGNSKWVASRLASATHERLVSIADCMRQTDTSINNTDEPFTLNQDERLGFVFPVHGWRVPQLVRNFIAKMSIRQAAVGQKPFTYCVCTAGDSIGLTIKNLNKALASNPSLLAMDIRQVASSYSLIMPESYVGLPFMDVDPQEREIKKREMAKQELKVICEEILNRKEGGCRLVKGPIPWFFTQVVGGFFEHVLITDKPFHVEKERCVRCGICSNVCPVGDIKGGHGEYPQWQHHKNCLTCFTCYHHCPHHAIEFGRQTQKKGQYYFK